MMVAGQRIGQTPILHHGEGDAIGEGPLLVQPGEIEIAAAGEEGGGGGDDFDVPLRLQAFDEHLKQHS